MDTAEDGERSQPPHDTFDADAYVDAANRLERSIDTQIQILEGIDDKAEHLTRLVALLVGLVFSVISLVTQLGEQPVEPPRDTILSTFGVGIGALLTSMVAAIVTYLSSRYRIGLHQNVGEVLSDDEFGTELPEHIRNVLGAYAVVLGENRKTIVANIRWFRATLVFLLVGVVFVSLSGFLYIARLARIVEAVLAILAVAISIAIGWLIWTGGFLPPQTKREARTND